MEWCLSGSSTNEHTLPVEAAGTGGPVLVQDMADQQDRDDVSAAASS